MSPIKNPELVVAIDFGSTYSGYAWQWRTDFVKNRGNIQFNDQWGSGALQLHKTKTCLLLKANEGNGNEYKIESFGHEAERMYIDMFKKEKDSIHGKWYLFKRFKHLLYSKDNHKRIMVEDQLDQPLPLFDVVSKFIQALKNHFMGRYGQNVNEEKTLWVVTVPAIWSDAARAFMQEAAEEGGIKADNLLLALEPEAAVVYCIHLPKEQRTNLHDLGTPGQVFLTADLGGMTADLSALEVLEDGTLKEICLSKGELAGGQNINEAFFQVCHDSFDGESWKKTFGKSTPTEILQMEDDFEQKKVTIGGTDARVESIALNVPYRIMKEIENNNIKLKVTADVEQSFKLEEGEMMFKSEFVRNTLFKETCLKICDIIKTQLEADSLKNCNLLVLVGGFAKSPIAVQQVTEKIKECFPDIKIVVPTSPFHAVLKGAVLYGHDPLIFRSRISRFTYGVGANVLFDDKRHDERKKWLNAENNKHYCKEVFSVHVEKGQSVILKEHLKEHTYNPMYKHQKTVMFSIYASEKVPLKSIEGGPESVMYTTDDGCKKLGEVNANIPDTTEGTQRKVLVHMIYGGTALSVIAKDETSGTEFPLKINFRT